MSELEARCLLLIRCLGPINAARLRRRVGQHDLHDHMEYIVKNKLVEWNFDSWPPLVDVTEKGRRRFSQVVRKRPPMEILREKFGTPEQQAIAVLKKRQINWADL